MIELNKIYNCDNIQGMKDFVPDESIDLTVTSPPYDNLRDYKGYVFDFENVAKELYRVTKQGGVVVWVVGDATVNGSESGTSFKQALYFKETGFNLHDTMIYQKSNFANPSSTRYHQIFEYMFIFTKGKIKTFNPIKDKVNSCAGETNWGKNSHRQKDGSQTISDKKIYNEFGMRLNVWLYNTAYGFNSKDKEAHKHPAIFPEKLANDHIISWSNEGDVVLDCFMGSGTTAKMAMVNKRNYIGFEISKEYCDLAEKRLEETKEKLTNTLF